MTSPGHAERIWLLLVGLTLAGAGLGEMGGQGWPLTVTVAFLIAFKGRLVVDHYMEMRRASPVLRRLVLAFTVVLPILALLTHVFGPDIARVSAAVARFS